MCGIAGIFSFCEDSNVLRKIEEMTDIVRHRGPDDEGFVFFSGLEASPEFRGGKDTPDDCYSSGFFYLPRNIFNGSINPKAFAALGHRRLSILDLSPAGHQPMSTGDGRYVIVFNGEIYNYLELRSELEELGCSFVSNGDTEVILHAYKHWGKDCLHRFNGMFAFILFDRFNCKVFAARDRYGVKPLYYWYSPEGFLAFASEIKQFTMLPGWRPLLNGQRAYDFLTWGLSDHTGETLFERVYQFRGGEYLETKIDEISKGLPLQTWYTFETTEIDATFEESVDYFRHLLTDSVRLRLRSDVPVGYSLSGGLDSSSLVCIADRFIHQSNPNNLQRTFFAGVDVKELDESEFADEVVTRTNAQMQKKYPTGDELLRDLETVLWHQDEPFRTTSVYAEWCVYRLMAEHGITVSIERAWCRRTIGGLPDIPQCLPCRTLLQSSVGKTLGESQETEALQGQNCGTAQ